MNRFVGANSYFLHVSGLNESLHLKPIEPLYLKLQRLQNSSFDSLYDVEYHDKIFISSVDFFQSVVTQDIVVGQ